MTDQELNHLIATKILGWTQSEGIVYLDTNDAYCYLADHCNSIPHALDLAKAHGIGLKPVDDGWMAWQLSEDSVSTVDSIASKAIVLCLLHEELTPEAKSITEELTETP